MQARPVAGSVISMLTMLRSGALLTKPKVHETNGARTITDALHPAYVFDGDTLNWALKKRYKLYTPLSDHLYEVLRGTLKTYLPDDQEYNRTFNRFEYMRALFEVDQRKEEHQYPTIGRFGWQWRGPTIWNEIESEVANEGRNWAPIKAGWFGGNLERFKAAHKTLIQMVSNLRWM
jgi:hypothetical protein